jgi:hypothetical protein
VLPVAGSAYLSHAVDHMSISSCANMGMMHPLTPAAAMLPVGTPQLQLQHALMHAPTLRQQWKCSRSAVSAMTAFGRHTALQVGMCQHTCFDLNLGTLGKGTTLVRSLFAEKNTAVHARETVVRSNTKSSNAKSCQRVHWQLNDESGCSCVVYLWLASHVSLQGTGHPSLFSKMTCLASYAKRHQV